MSNSNYPLFYSNLVPINYEAHGKLSLKERTGFAYAKNTNAIPVTLSELAHILPSYPIVFSTASVPTILAIVGFQNNNNLFVNPVTGAWLSDAHVPSYVQRYPFYLEAMPNSDQFVLCLDLTSNNFEEGNGMPLFLGEEQPSELLRNVFDYCKYHHQATRQTETFCQLIASLDILVERSIELKINENQKITFSGFQTIDEQKLQALDDQTILKLREYGYLSFIYAHLFSEYRWNDLVVQSKKQTALPAEQQIPGSISAAPTAKLWDSKPISNAFAKIKA